MVVDTGTEVGGLDVIREVSDEDISVLDEGHVPNSVQGAR
jgi:hypothetical protein